MTDFVRKAYLEHELMKMKWVVNKLVRQNKCLITRFGQLVNNQKNYMDHRMPMMQGYERYAEKMKDLQSLKYKLDKKIGGLHLNGDNKNGVKRYLFMLTLNEKQKLRALLKMDRRKK